MMATSIPMVAAGELKRTWGWFLALGICLIVLGTIALGVPVLVTDVSVLILGWLLLIGGVLQAIHGFMRRAWEGFFVDLLVGLLYVVVGFMFIDHPLATAEMLTLMMAALLMLGGLFRIVAVFSTNLQHRLWLLLNGAITLVLGVMIWKQWPESALWVIGLFIGIDMIFNGWALVMLALAVRSVPAEST
jgi:uncharacterized membrane protein HdeD (DUF308 family)